jgi:hypothetical protein
VRQFDKIFFGLIIGGFFPLLLFLLGLLVWFGIDGNEDHALVYVSTGVLAGIVIDLLFVKGWLKNMYEIPAWFAATIYLFYNIAVYGMFMGFPVFHAFAGIIAGYYYGRRIKWKNVPEVQYPGYIKKVSLFTTIIMTVVCISSGIIGLTGNGAGSEVRHMLHLGFEITRPMLWAIVLTGGSVLILIQYILTQFVMRWVCQINFTL